MAERNLRKSLDDAVVSCAALPRSMRKRPWEHEQSWVLERVLASRRADIKELEYILECRRGCQEPG
jgi:hypothetical protein